MRDAAGALVAGIQHDSPPRKPDLPPGDVIAEVIQRSLMPTILRFASRNRPGKMVKLTIRRQSGVERPAAKSERMKQAVTRNRTRKIPA